MFHNIFGYPLNLRHPKSFNEKLNWLKLYDHNPFYSTLVDKIAVKQWVAEKIGAKYIIPTLAVWERAEDIDITNLPNQFVLKCNHDAGSTIICYNKTSFDLEAAKKQLRESLNNKFYLKYREWAYKYVKPKILAEKYIADVDVSDVPDYKFFCFNGEVSFLYVATERNNPNTETRFDFFDINYNHLAVLNEHPNADNQPPKPQCFNQMVTFSKILSHGFSHVRCDFYEVNGKLYFGECTLYHCGGMTQFKPFEFDVRLGDMLKLPQE